MTRDELIRILEGIRYVHHPANNVNKVLAEYDRLTAINAQLIGFLKARLILEPNKPVIEIWRSQLEAVIRAAEENHDQS